MKKILLLSIAMLAFFVSYGQDYISFEYDDAGNRERRRLISLKSGEMEDEVPEAFEDQIEETNFTIYPNPTKGMLKVDIKNLDFDTKSSIMVFDVQGRRIYENNAPAYSNTIDLSNQKPGTYIMLLKAGDKTSEWKIIKE